MQRKTVRTKFLAQHVLVEYNFQCRYDVMLLCWKDDPDNRPTFQTLVDIFQNFLIDAHSERDNHYGFQATCETSSFSSSENASSDDSVVFANALSVSFSNAASPRYSEVPHSRNRSSHHDRQEVNLYHFM